MEIAPDTVFYDGGCGLCHWTIRFLVAADRSGKLFRYAPLGSGAFERMVPPEARQELPDSILVRDSAGALYTQSSAIIHLLDRLGGLWRLFAHCLRLVPTPIRDGAYQTVAAVRRRVFRDPEGVCPVMAPEALRRFDLSGSNEDPNPKTNRENPPGADSLTPN